MRVVAGEFKGRRLAGPRRSTTRPTADRVREALFSIVGDISGEAVLDLFAGTGALGIEALSRGAASATFVERDGKVLPTLRANLKTVFDGVPPDDLAQIVKSDALRFLESPPRRYGLVLLDPPYAEAERLGTRLAELLPLAAEPGSLIVAECDRRVPLVLEIPAQDATHPLLALLNEYRYGDTLLRVFRAPQAD